MEFISECKSKDMDQTDSSLNSLKTKQIYQNYSL